MKRLFILIVLISFVISGCKKDEDPSLSGTVTIDNKIYQSTTYYAYGFSFSKAEKVSTLEAPGPDVTLFVITDTPENRLTFQVSNLNPSFYKLGDYPDVQTEIRECKSPMGAKMIARKNRNLLNRGKM